MSTPSFSLLFDENISYRVMKHILHLFPGSETAKRLKLIAKEDFLIWENAKSNGFTIITYNDDYGLLSNLRG